MVEMLPPWLIERNKKVIKYFQWFKYKKINKSMTKKSLKLNFIYEITNIFYKNYYLQIFIF